MAADALIDDLLAALGERGVLTSPTDRARFETGWRRERRDGRNLGGG